MSLRNNALLVSLSVSKPTMSVTDKKATSDAESANNAHNAGAYRKNLYPKHLTGPIKNAESHARDYLASVTYQMGKNEYVLPTAKYMDFAEQMARLELAFNQAVTVFLQNWTNVLDQAQQAQGDLFDAGAYPDVTELRRQFDFKVRYRPISDIGDFVLDLESELQDEIKEQAKAVAMQEMDSFMQEPLKRLQEVVQRLHDTAGKGDRIVTNSRTNARESRAPIFRDTVCENIVHEIDLLLDFADVLPQSVVDLAKDTLHATPEPDAMRNNDTVRKETHAKTADLLAQIDNLLG